MPYDANGNMLEQARSVDDPGAKRFVYDAENRLVEVSSPREVTVDVTFRPGWNFFGPYEYRDAHKVEALVNVHVNQFFYNRWLGVGLPDNIILRELPGFLLVIGYFVVFPPILANFVFRKMYVQMGFIRFNIMVNFLLWMAALPLKMALRWSFNLKYIVAIPEYFFNI